MISKRVHPNPFATACPDTLEPALLISHLKLEQI